MSWANLDCQVPYVNGCHKSGKWGIALVIQYIIRITAWQINEGGNPRGTQVVDVYRFDESPGQRFSIDRPKIKIRIQTHDLVCPWCRCGVFVMRRCKWVSLTSRSMGKLTLWCPYPCLDLTCAWWTCIAGSSLYWDGASQGRMIAIYIAHLHIYIGCGASLYHKVERLGFDWSVFSVDVLWCSPAWLPQNVSRYILKFI